MLLLQAEWKFDVNLKAKIASILKKMVFFLYFKTILEQLCE